MCGEYYSGYHVRGSEKPGITPGFGNNILFISDGHLSLNLTQFKDPALIQYAIYNLPVSFNLMIFHFQKLIH
ncbi:hypothetical protein EJP617_08240 [Erwinia sp. Ejp617]|nr:hypothetical protein EJP617_08240 [Erwinia sp. Ejp617]